MPDEKKDDKAKKWAGKYATPEEAEEAWGEAQKLIGKHAKTIEEMQAQNQQLMTWAQSVAPTLQFVQQNAQTLAKLWEHRDRLTAAPTNGLSPQQNAQMAALVPGFSLMTAEEQHALGQAIQQQYVQPVIQQMDQVWQKRAQELVAQVGNGLGSQQRAATDVLWKMLEASVPKEKLDYLRDYQKKALEFADPSKIDPMKLAQEHLGQQAEMAGLKTRLAEYEKKFSDYEKAQVPSLHGGPTPTLTYKPEDVEALKDPRERFQRVMQDTKEAVGSDALAETFGSGFTGFGRG